MPFPYTFPFTFGEEAAIEHGMAMIDIAENIEQKYDVFSEVSQSKARKTTAFYSINSYEPKIISEDIAPIKLDFIGMFQENEDIERQKLHYLLATDNDVLLIYFDRDIATYIKLPEAVIKDNPMRMDDVLFDVSCVTKGKILGQIRAAIDNRCTTTGSEIIDAEALRGKAIQLDYTEYTHFTQSQNDYMLPEGDYEMIVRMRGDGSAEMDMEVKNTTDVSVIATTTKTLDSAYKIYTLTFTINNADVGDSIRFKVTASIADKHVNVDFIGFVAV